MKKSFLALVLMFVLALPVLASEQGDMEADVKLGLGLNPSIKVGSNSEDMKTALRMGADFFYYVDPSVALGAGVNYMFDTEIENEGLKIGFTDVYFAVKPKMKLESDIFDSIYFIGQLGYGTPRADQDVPDLKGGICWALGVGTEIQSFIVEVVYNVDNGEVGDNDFSISSIYLNAGYKFAL